MVERSPWQQLQIVQALRFVAEDPRWHEKLGLAAVIAMVPVLNFALTGYRVSLIRNVADGRDLPLPEWRDVTGLWWQGLPLALATWIYAAPMLLVLAAGAVFTVAALAVADAGGDPWVALGAVGLVAVVGMLFLGAYGLALSLVRPTLEIQYAREGTFASCFAWGTMLGAIRRNFEGYAVLWLALFAARTLTSTVLSPIISTLSAIPAIGQLLTMVVVALVYTYLGLAAAHLEGQLLGADEAAVSEHPPPEPLPQPA